MRGVDCMHVGWLYAGMSEMSTESVKQQPLLIGGEWVGAEGGRTFGKADPFTGEAVTEAAAASVGRRGAAAEAADAAFPGVVGPRRGASARRSWAARPTCWTSARRTSPRR